MHKVMRRPRQIATPILDDELQTLYIIRATTFKGKLLGYIGRKTVEDKSFGDLARTMRTWDISRTMVRPWKFVFVLVADIISPERKFLRPTDDMEQDKRQRKALQKYLQREKIEPENQHICTLKFHRRSVAKKLIKSLPRKRDYQVVKIQMTYGKPYTAQLLSN